MDVEAERLEPPLLSWLLLAPSAAELRFQPSGTDQPGPQRRRPGQERLGSAPPRAPKSIAAECGHSEEMCPNGDPASLGECLRESREIAVRSGLCGPYAVRAAFLAEVVFEESIANHRLQGCA